jgi:hypothetical protein
VLWYRQNAIDNLGDDANNIYDEVYIAEFSKEFPYTGSYQTFTVPQDGNYKIELWGAQGGDGRYWNTTEYRTTLVGGKGAYTSGTIMLNAGSNIYIYVGGQGGRTDFNSATGGASGWNGGGHGGTDTDGTSPEAGAGGGGATDIRLTSGNWNDITSLRSRIMVAAGGGGSTVLEEDIRLGRPGGALTAQGATPYTVGGTQTTGGGFGVGADGWTETNAAENYGGFGGGGGGYYGGAFGQIFADPFGAGGAGGSSFISGYTGCNAINATGTHTGQPNHYSGFVFINMQMLAGNTSIPSTTGSTEIGHSGNGYAKITYIP